MTPIVLEAGPEAGHSIRQWQHVQLFSPWEYNVDKAAARLLAPTGWNSPDPQIYPTGAELLERYIEPLATKTALRDVIRTSSRVTAVGRAGFDKAKTKGREAAPFEIRYQNGKGPETLRADAVIDASGTWGSPNPAGAGGLAAIGEREAAARISYGMPDVLGKRTGPFAGKTVAVLGAGHSAIGTLTDLTTLAQQAPGTTPDLAAARNGPHEGLWRRGQRQTVGPRRARRRISLPRRIRSGAGRAGFPVAAISQTDGRLRIATSTACCGRSIVADELVVATGFRPDLSFLSEVRAAARSGDRSARCAGAADRSERALLRHGAPARRARTRAGRSRLLPRRHQVLRPCADLSDDHRLRTGPLDRGRHRRRQGGRSAGRARACRRPASARAAAWKPALRPGAAAARPERTYRRAARRMRRRSRQVPAVAGAHEASRPVTMRRMGTIIALGTAQTIAWASSYYMPAILAAPIARDLGVTSTVVFGSLSGALVIAGLIGPRVGHAIDTFGGRGLLATSNLVFAVGLLLLSAAAGPRLLIAAWIALGLGMGLGLYEAAFATLTRIYGSAARRPITGITLIAGFASTVGWPLTSWLDAHFGWRIACQIWAGIHIVLALPLNLALPRAANPVAEQHGDEAQVASGQSESFQMAAVAYVFAATGFVSSGMSAIMPALLVLLGATPSAALFARNADRAVAGRRANSRGWLANQVSSVALGAIGDAHQSCWSGFARDRRAWHSPRSLPSSMGRAMGYSRSREGLCRSRCSDHAGSGGGSE